MFTGKAQVFLLAVAGILLICGCSSGEATLREGLTRLLEEPD